jgi:hypothetical protein
VLGQILAHDLRRHGNSPDIAVLSNGQLRTTEWNTGAREKDLAHLGGLDG